MLTFLFTLLEMVQKLVNFVKNLLGMGNWEKWLIHIIHKNKNIFEINNIIYNAITWFQNISRWFF